MTDRQSRPCYWMLLDSQLQIKALPAELEKPEINSNLLDLIHNDDRPTFQKAIIDNPVFFKNLVGRKLVARVLGHIDDQFYSAEFRFLAINSQFIILFLHVEKSVSCTTFSTLGLQEKFQSVLESHIDIDPTTFRFFQLLDSASLDVLLAYPKGYNLTAKSQTNLPPPPPKSPSKSPSKSPTSPSRTPVISILPNPPIQHLLRDIGPLRDFIDTIGNDTISKILTTYSSNHKRHSKQFMTSTPDQSCISSSYFFSHSFKYNEFASNNSVSTLMVKYGQVCLLISEPVGFKYPGTLEDTTIPSETDDFGVEVNIDDMVSPIDSINSRRSSADIKRKISDGDNVPIAKRPSFGEEKAGNRIMTLAQTASDSRGYMSYAKRPIEVRKRSVEEEKHYYQHQRPPYGYDERQYEYNRHPTGYYPGYYDQHNRPEYRRPPIDYQRGPPPGEYYPRPAGDYSRAEYHSYNPQIYPSVQGYHPSSGHSSQGYHPSGPSQAPSAYHPVAPNPQGPLVYHPIGPGLPPLSQSHASGPVERPPSATSAQIPPYSAVSGYSAPNGASVPPEPVVYLPSAPSAAPVSTYSSATAPSINALPHPPYREYPPSYYHPNEYNQYYLPHPQFYDDPRHSHYGYNARPYAPPGQYYRHYPDQPPSPSQSYQPQVYSGSSLPATTSAQPQMYPPSSLPDSARREYPVYQPVLMKPEEGDNSEVDNELNEDVVEGEDES